MTKVLIFYTLVKIKNFGGSRETRAPVRKGKPPFELGFFIWIKQVSLLSQAFDQTDRDFDSIRLRLQNLIKSAFPDWTDFSVASFGNILIELFAFVGDVLTFYQDNQARESRITTATQRKNLIGLVKLLGFKPSGARAATADVQFTLSAPPATDVIIPKGTTVKTASSPDPVSFQLLSDLTIPARTSPPTITGSVEHSQTQDEMFVSTGLPNQEFILGSTPFLDNSCEIEAGNGRYLEVQNFLGSSGIDRHFTVIVDQNDRAIIRFGNGINGVIPSGTISVIYKTGGGAIGNINANTLNKIDGYFLDTAGNSINISVNNLNPSSGGCDRQTIAQIKALAPESIRVLNRTICREDFEINAKRLPEVARALMLTSNEFPGIAENSGILFIIPRGGSLPSQELKELVERQVTQVYPCAVTFQVMVQDPVYRQVDIQARIHLREGANRNTIKTSILNVLSDYFSISLPDGKDNSNVDFGFNIKDQDGNPVGEIAYSDVFNLIRDVPGVRKIDGHNGLLLNGQPDDLAIGLNEFPILGQTSLIDGLSGQQI